MIWEVVKAIWNNAPSFVVFAAIILSIFEFGKIPVHPLRGFLKWVDNSVNEDIREDLKDIKKQISDNASESAEHDVLNLRHTLIQDATYMEHLHKEKGVIASNMFDMYFDNVKAYVKLSEKYKITDGYVLRSIKIVNDLSNEILGEYLFTKAYLEDIEKRIKL